MTSFLGGGSIVSYKMSRYSRPTRFNDIAVRDKSHPTYVIRKSLYDYIRADLEEQSRRLFHQRVFIFAKNKLDIEPPPPPPMQISARSQASTYTHATLDSSRFDTIDFKIILQMELMRMFFDCDESSISGSRPTGFFIYMGEYSLLLIECAEDIVGCLCAQLSAVADKFFVNNKVFLTEDRIDESFFDSFNYYRAAAININEKFPAHTNTDIELMSQQHLTIKTKLYDLCDALAEKLRNEREAYSTTSANKAPAIHLMKRDADETLPSNVFNKILPEVQRIELVLTCNRFYCNVERRALLYQNIPPELDDEVRAWPISYNYTPTGVFRYTPYDVNLTFSDYGKKEESEGEKGSGSEGSEAKGEAVPK